MTYQNPPKVPVSFFGPTWTHQSQNYFWHPPVQQTEYPHLHLTGGTVSEIVTISNLSYTTGGAGGNINIVFSAASGFQLITQDITYKMAYNTTISALNAALLKV